MTAIEEIRARIQAAFGPKDLALFFQAMAEIAQESEEVHQALSEVEDISMNMVIEGAVECHLRLEKGKLAAGKGTLGDARLTVRMAETTAQAVFSGESDFASAYMAGDIQLEGDMGDALKLPQIFQTVGPHLGRALFPMAGGM